MVMAMVMVVAVVVVVVDRGSGGGGGGGGCGSDGGKMTAQSFPKDSSTAYETFFAVAHTKTRPYYQTTRYFMHYAKIPYQVRTVFAVGCKPLGSFRLIVFLLCFAALSPACLVISLCCFVLLPHFWCYVARLFGAGVRPAPDEGPRVVRKAEQGA